MSNAIWVVGSYEGLKAKSVLEHAQAGVGYIIQQNSGSGKSFACVASFRYYVGKDGLPPHLDQITDPYKIQRLNNDLARRNNMHEE